MNYIPISSKLIIQYWLSLFSEISSVDKLQDILNNVSNIDLEEFAGSYNNTHVSDESVRDIELIIDMPVKKHLKENMSMHTGSDFYYFVQPIINYYSDRLYDAIMENEAILNPKDLFNRLVKLLVKKLNVLIDRTMVLEFNYCVLNKQLEGSSAQEKYEFFKNNMLKDKKYIHGLYEEYEQLFILLQKTVINNINMIIEIVENAVNDIDSISEEMNSSVRLEKITNVMPEFGDSHRGGKSVAVVEFDNKFKVVYKPRNLEIEIAFNKLLSLLGNRIESDEYKNLAEIKMLGRKSYGWVEFIENNPCDSKEQVRDFYIRAGQYLAILYSLNAKDIHYENIIANKDNPMLIDLETLFHLDTTTDNYTLSDSNVLAMKELDNSVYSIGMLPNNVLSSDRNERGIDVSGFGAKETQNAPFSYDAIASSDENKIKLKKKYGVIVPQQNNPVLNNTICDATEYISEISSGFRFMYHWILENSETYLNWLDDIFADTEIRVLMKSTYVYSRLLRTGVHPDIIRKEQNRIVLFHRMGVNAQESLNRVISSEVNDMLEGDIPYFGMKTNECGLKNSQGDIVLEFDNDPLSIAKEKIRSFSEKDLTRQLHFIDMSFKGRLSQSGKDITNTKYRFFTKAKDINLKGWLDLSIDIGDYILECAIEGKKNGESEITWISTILNGKEEINWQLSPVGNDLYNGNMGIGLFLSALYKVSGKDKYKTAAKSAVVSPINDITSLPVDNENLVGPFNGTSGYFYSLKYILDYLDMEQSYDSIIRNITAMHRAVDKDESCDVIGGSAGAAMALASLYKRVDNAACKEAIKQLLKKCAVKLMNKYEKVINDYYDNSIKDAQPILTGFAHGLSGTIAAISRINTVVNINGARSIIDRLIECENTLFSPKEQNWYSSELKEKYSHGWCYGAPGILLSRQELLSNSMSSERIEADYDTALETTKAKCFGYNPSLCHGDIGNLSILTYCARKNNDNALLNENRRLFHYIYENSLKAKWKQGLYRGTESLGMMIGLSGVGYSLLKYYTDGGLPEILILE